jgi:hypothetical protein
MKNVRSQNLLAAVVIGLTAFTATVAQAALPAEAVAKAGDPLPSWNEGKPKQSVVAFVEKVTKQGSPDFVPVAERIATFDNGGTLWSEQPTALRTSWKARHRARSWCLA